MISLNIEQKAFVDKLKQENNVICLSGGKDSFATVTIAEYLDIPFSVVTALVWWKDNITGENPYHFDFMQNELFKLENKGINVYTPKGVNAFDYMTTKVVRSKDHPERIGKYRGFPLCGACGIQRDCKTRVVNRQLKNLQFDNKLLGLCADEPNRSVHEKSLLRTLGIKKCETPFICKKSNRLSPVYNFANRNGCWFCPNQGLVEWEILYREFPVLWNELKFVQDLPNKITELLTRTETLYDIEKKINNGVQMRIFFSDLFEGEKYEIKKENSGAAEGLPLLR